MAEENPIFVLLQSFAVSLDRLARQRWLPNSYDPAVKHVRLKDSELHPDNLTAPDDSLKSPIQREMKNRLGAIAATPTGRQLLLQASQHGVSTHLEIELPMVLMRAFGYYFPPIKQFAVDPRRVFFGGPLGLPDIQYGRGLYEAVAAHELTHANQDATKSALYEWGLCTLAFAPMDGLLILRHAEANAQATATQVAWEMKENGKPEAWGAIKATAYGWMAYRFEEAVAADATAATDGRARMAAHLGWFDARQAYFKAYTEQVIKRYQSMLDMRAKLRGETPERALRSIIHDPKLQAMLRQSGFEQDAATAQKLQQEWHNPKEEKEWIEKQFAPLKEFMAKQQLLNKGAIAVKIADDAVLAGLARLPNDTSYLADFVAHGGTLHGAQFEWLGEGQGAQFASLFDAWEKSVSPADDSKPQDKANPPPPPAP